MKLSQEEINGIVNMILEIIEVISNRKLHVDAWIKGLGSFGADFDETVCLFFGAANPVVSDPQSYGLSEEESQILKKFSDEFDYFCDEHSSWPPFFIDTPAWAKIMDRAKEVLEVFNYQKHDEDKA